MLQNRYHDMLGKRVEVKSAVPRGQAPPPARPRARRRATATASPRRPRPAAPPAGTATPLGSYRKTPWVRPPGNDNPWGSNPGFNGGGPGGPGGNPNAGRPGASAGGYGGDKLGGGAGGAGDAAHGGPRAPPPRGTCITTTPGPRVSQWERPMELDFPMSSN